MLKFLSLIFKLKFQMFHTEILLIYILFKTDFLMNLLFTFVIEGERRKKEKEIWTAFIFNLTIISITWIFVEEKSSLK